jgi:uncharacterized protein
MAKLDTIRQQVNTVLFGQMDKALQAEGWAHLYGVSQTATQLAASRGLQVDICAAAGLLHDIHSFTTGEEKDHALHGAAEAAELLRTAGGWAEGEINTVCGMILQHSDKQTIGSPLEECLKDADVFAHWLFEREKKMNAAKRARLVKVMNELGTKG